jgi:MFS family permease
VIAPAPEREGAPAVPAASWRRNPWWIPPFLGSVPDLDPVLLRALGLVSLAMFFEAYDLSMLTSALKHIAEGLSIQESRLPWYLGAIRLGGLLAFLVVPFADRLGRRRIFLVSLAGMSVATLATSLVQTPLQFVICQLVTRAFLLTMSAMAVVILAEEFPAAHRGWGIGMLGALGSFGYGLGALIFAFVDVLPFGWRALYAVGVVPLLLLPTFRRNVRETARFEEHRARRIDSGSRSALREWLTPLVALARTHPARALCVGLAGFLSSLGAIAVFQFTAYHVQTVHGWAPWQYSLMFIGAGLLGIVGNVAAGRLGDRIGRRVVGFTAFALYPVGAIAFYLGPGWSLPLCWALIVFTGTAGDVIVRAFSTELFPTSHRGTAAGWLTLVNTLGWILGLWIVYGVLRYGGTTLAGNLPGAISLLSAGVLVGGVFLLFLPETRQRELEAISEDA